MEKNNTEEKLLSLTINRTFQQKSNERLIHKKIAERIKKQKRPNTPFTMHPEQPHYCKSVPRFLFYVKNGKYESVKKTLIPCKSWRCPECAPKKAKQVSRMLQEVIVLNNLTYFLTLTLDPKTILSKIRKNTHAYITKIFNHFLVRLKREDNILQNDLKYVWVVEFQKNGNAHLHILLNTHLDISIVREHWMHVGGGIMMRVELVKSLPRAANYISKYIMKSVNDFQNRASTFLRLGQRRYSISRSCLRPPRALAQKISFKDLPEELKYLVIDALYFKKEYIEETVIL